MTEVEKDNTVLLDANTVKLPVGAIKKIIKEPKNKFSNRHAYRMAKREFRLERRIAEIKAVDSPDRLKAYKFDKAMDIIKLIIYVGFTCFLVFFAPDMVPQMIKEMLGL